ncbi:MAG: glutamate racemase [Clostridia bacterium]|nr:glutamate racemase [Clostridia bacterium]
MKIGFFDSGVGGLSVLREALKVLPEEEYLYYADTQHVPYGIKPKEEVKKYIFAAVEFMAAQGLKALVVACNTATSIAVRELRGMYDFPLVGMEPAVKPAVEKWGHKEKRVLVLATPLTLQEEKFRNLVARVDNDHIVDMLPCPELVVLAEKLEFREEVIIPFLTEKLAGFDLSQYGTIVLGCTHYPLYRDIFKQVLPSHMDIIDGNLGTVNQLINLMADRGMLSAAWDGKRTIPEGRGEVVRIDFYHSGKKVDNPSRLDIYRQLLGLNK